MSRGRLVVLAAVAAALAAPPAHAAECSSEPTPGGEWRSYGHDAANTRVQPAEKVISPGDVATLSPAWSFSTVDAGGKGDITGTPIVADGCLYVATNRGWVFALNADSGEMLWKSEVPYGGGVNSTVTLGKRVCGEEKVRIKRKGKKGKKGRKGKKGKRRKRRKRFRTVKVRCDTLYVAMSRTAQAEGCPEGDPCEGPYVAAFDRNDGSLVWATPPIDSQEGSDTYGTPVLFKRVLMIGVSGGSAELGDEADRYAFQGSMVFLDKNTGELLHKEWTIHPPQQPEDEFAGAGVWSTPAVDAEEKVAYAGTANPFKPQAEHPHANAVVKYDLDRKSPTFGRIIGSYKGNIDEYIPGLSEAPCYDIPGNPPPYYPQGIGACGDIDLDFGASPNLYKDANGRKLVGSGQKSGVYHVFDAATMEPVDTQIVGPPGALGGIVGSTAHDGENVYGPITVPGYIWSIRASDLGLRWVGPVADGAHWGPPVAVANGVVYTVDTSGFLDAYDARSGALLAKRPLALGGSKPRSLSWGGVSVARNTVYASVGLGSLDEGFVVAFKRAGPDEAADDAQDSVTGLLGGGGGGGGGGASSAIVAGPGAVYTTYATPVVITQVGGPLSFANLDLPQHDVVADEKAPDGSPLFKSKLSGLGEVAPVEGLERVQSGKTYGFYCSLHPGMRGQLIVR